MAYHHYHHHHFNPSHPAHLANPIYMVHHHHRSQKTYTEVDSTATTVPTNGGEANHCGVIAVILLFAIVIMGLFAHDSH